MHNHNGKGQSAMMWMMVICCAVPLVFLLFAGQGVSLGGNFWAVLIGAFIVIHLWMMFRRHGGKNEK